jgi:hypothetical protein
MGWADRARAAAKVASKVTSEALAEFDAKHAGDADYQRWKMRAGQAVAGAREVAEGAREVATEALTEAGATPTGKAVGDKARSMAKVLTSLPLFTAVFDAAKARHGVDELYARYAEQLDDPTRAVQLAEGLDRVQRDLGVYRRVRSVTSPTYAVRRQLILSAVKLGDDHDDPVRVQLLKRAFVLSRRRLQTDQADAEALHVLSRVYLAQSDLQTALTSCKMALLADPADGLAWTTLARIQLEADDLHASRLSATKAVSLGADYANELLATLVLADMSDAAGIAEFERLRSLITHEGRRGYLGTSVDAQGALRYVKDQQVRRAMDVVAWAKGMA